MSLLSVISNFSLCSFIRRNPLLIVDVRAGSRRAGRKRKLVSSRGGPLLSSPLLHPLSRRQSCSPQTDLI